MDNMEQKNWFLHKRILTVALILLMLFMVMPQAVFADEEENVTAVTESLADNGPTVTVSTYEPDTSKLNLFSDGAIIYCVETGQILFGDHIDKKLDPLSMTKVMTALCVMKEIEAGRMTLDDVVTVKKQDTKVPESKIYLEEGEKLTVRSLLYAALVYSGNDAAAALGTAVSGNRKAFAKYMNRVAKELGCTNTNFKNAHGLIVKGHYSTCRDMALIGRAAFAYDFVRKICQTKKYKIPPTNKYDDEIELELTNPFFSEMEGVKKPYVKYGIIAGKTGTWDLDNASLMEMAEYGDRHFITVVMNDALLERYHDSVDLIEVGWDALDKQAKAEKKGEGAAGRQDPDGSFPSAVLQSSIVQKFTDWVNEKAEAVNADITCAEYGKSGVALQWRQVPNVSGYKVFRDSGDGFRLIGQIDGAEVLTYTDETAETDTIYRYYVRGCSENGGLLWW